MEYYSSDLQSGWVVVAHRVPNETHTVHNLRPDTKYMFLVRAENSHGLSVPSEMSDVVHTLGNEGLYFKGINTLGSLLLHIVELCLSNLLVSLLILV